MNNTPLNIKDISTLEDSRYFVNRAVEALNLQMRRLENYDFEKDDVAWLYIADSHFYIVALKRLRQTILVCKKVSRVWAEVQSDFKQFDQSTSDAIAMRHALEHVDDHIRGDGRTGIKNSEMYTVIFNNDGFEWAGGTFNRNTLHEASEKLVKKYREVTSKEFALYKKANEATN